MTMALYHKVVKGNVDPPRALEIIFGLGARRKPHEAVTGELLTDRERDALSDRVISEMTLEDVDISDDNVTSCNGVRLGREGRWEQGNDTAVC